MFYCLFHEQRNDNNLGDTTLDERLHKWRDETLITVPGSPLQCEWVLAPLGLLDICTDEARSTTLESWLTGHPELRLVQPVQVVFLPMYTPRGYLLIVVQCVDDCVRATPVACCDRSLDQKGRLARQLRKALRRWLELTPWQKRKVRLNAMCSSAVEVNDWDRVTARFTQCMTAVLCDVTADAHTTLAGQHSTTLHETTMALEFMQGARKGMDCERE